MFRQGNACSWILKSSMVLAEFDVESKTNEILYSYSVLLTGLLQTFRKIQEVEEL